MAQTATSILPVLREAWSDSEIVKQFEDGNGPLSRIEKVKGKPIGKQLQVPIHKGRNLGGFTSVGPAGGNLNDAGQQAVDQGTYNLIYNYLSIELDASAIIQAETDAQSVINSKDLEIEGGIENVRHQAVRQLMTNGDGIVAQCGTSGGASTTLPLVASPSGSAYGYDALIRGWLGVGSRVDVGTTGDTDALVAATEVSAISFQNPAAPTITIGSAIDATAGTHFVYIANPNSGTAANPEMNGLRNMVATSGALAGLNPATAGQEYFSAAARDTTTTVFSLDLPLYLQRQIMQFSGKAQSEVWTGLKQQMNFYSLLQNQVRFAGDVGASAGSVSTVKWNGMTVDAFPDVLDSDWYQLTLSDLVRVTGSFDGAKWMSQLAGDSNLEWAQGTTRFKDAVVMPMQVGVRRRNTQAAATGLTA